MVGCEKIGKILLNYELLELFTINTLKEMII